jgi:hypothetical protein
MTHGSNRMTCFVVSCATPLARGFTLRLRQENASADIGGGFGLASGIGCHSYLTPRAAQAALKRLISCLSFHRSG